MTYKQAKEALKVGKHVNNSRLTMLCDGTATLIFLNPKDDKIYYKRSNGKFVHVALFDGWFLVDRKS